MNVTHHNDPWDYITIDGFLNEDDWQSIQEQALEELEQYKLVGTNTKLGVKYVRFLDYDPLPQANFLFKEHKKHRDFEGELKKLSHWSIQKPGAKYPTHIDNESRVHTTMLYVAPEKNIGTILCKNKSSHVEDHGQPEHESDYEIEVPWAPNKIFSHNTIPGVTWHRYDSDETHSERITLSTFFIEPSKVIRGRGIEEHLIDIDSKYYK